MAVIKSSRRERPKVKARRRIPFSLKPMIEEGEFEAKITNAEIADSVDFGNDKIPRLAVDFLLKDGRRLKQNLLLIESTNNPAYQLIMTVFGCLEDAYVDGLIGKEVGIEVVHKNTDAGTFANVKRVFSINDDCEEDAEAEELSSELHEEEVTEEAPYDSDGEDEMDI